MASGDTVASGNVKLGVDVTPMEQGLEAAKAKAEAGAAAVQAAVNTATTGGTQATSVPAAAAEAAKAINVATVATAKSETVSKAAAAATGGLAGKLKGILGPAGEVAGAVGSVVGKLSLITALAGGVVSAFLAIGKAINAPRDAARQAAKELQALQQQIDALRNTPVTDAFDPDEAGTSIREKYAKRLAEMYDLHMAAMTKASKARNAVREQQLSEELRVEETGLRKQEQQELESLRRREELNRNMASTAEAYKQQFELQQQMAAQIANISRQSQDSMSQSLDRMEVSISKIGELVEALRRNTGRDA